MAMLFGVSSFFTPARPRRSSRPARSAAISYYDHRAAPRRRSAPDRPARPAQFRQGAPVGRRGQRPAGATSSTSTPPITASPTPASTRHVSRPSGLPRRAFRRSRSKASSTGTAASFLEDAAAVRARPAGPASNWSSRSACSPPPAAKMPTTLAETKASAKDIRYSNWTLNTTFELSARRRYGAVSEAGRQAGRPARRSRREALATLPTPRPPSRSSTSSTCNARASRRTTSFARRARALVGRHDRLEPALEDPRWLGRGYLGTASTSSTSRPPTKASKTVPPTSSPGPFRHRQANGYQVDRHRHHEHQRNRRHRRGRRQVVIADLNAAPCCRRRSRRPARARWRWRWMSPTNGQVNAAVAEVLGFRSGVDILFLVDNTGIQIVHPLEDFPFMVEEDAHDPPRRRLSHDRRRLPPHAADQGAATSSSHGLGALQGRRRMLKAPYVMRPARPTSGSGQRDRQAQSMACRANVIYPGFVPHALVDRQIPEQAKVLGAQRGRRRQEGDAEGHRRRRIPRPPPTSPPDRPLLRRLATSDATAPAGRVGREAQRLVQQ